MPTNLALDPLQIGIFAALTLAIGALTWWRVSQMKKTAGDDESEYFLAGRSLGWMLVAGSITLTNLSTDQLVGMNGNQMALLAWWELSAVVGLIILAFVFLPIYYKNNCRTTTELLGQRYNDRNIRALIAALFLLGNIIVFLPVMLYTGSLFLKSMFGVDWPILSFAIPLALIGSAYAIFGGLRAVAVSDAISGVGVLGVAVLVVVLSLMAIDFDLSGIPAERLTMIGGNDSPIPWHTLLTGMIFIQIFYWSTNQTITQRAMAASSLREAQKGVMAAAGIRLLIVPAIVVIPGIVAFKLFGDVGDAAYGQIVGAVLPPWLSGAFAAMIAAAVLTSFNSVLNSSTTLYVLDIHETYFDSTPNVGRMNLVITLIFVGLAILLVPIYQSAESIINLVQQLFGLLSMPILSAFIVGLVFRNVGAGAAMTGVLSGTLIYACFTFVWTPLHYIHLMLITLIASISIALIYNRLILGNKEEFVGMPR
ncbi:SLC5 family protein [Hyphobacterium sp. CCMP332]|uniref:SLC5 family protein n=1 Tax=Hyphobacterium sp. CCMP332 TaxID=2749086 RepID=UPI00164F50AB|nr:SLC5 family protein [Hyphobacterium sp. CCMP332]QNL19681.1 SLC5 family protein [Hyphobacterium sp. CCMP332]